MPPPDVLAEIGLGWGLGTELFKGSLVAARCSQH